MFYGMFNKYRAEPSVRVRKHTQAAGRDRHQTHTTDKPQTTNYRHTRKEVKNSNLGSFSVSTTPKSIFFFILLCENNVDPIR